MCTWQGVATCTGEGGEGEGREGVQMENPPQVHVDLTDGLAYPRLETFIYE